MPFGDHQLSIGHLDRPRAGQVEPTLHRPGVANHQTPLEEAGRCPRVLQTHDFAPCLAAHPADPFAADVPTLTGLRALAQRHRRLRVAHVVASSAHLEITGEHDVGGRRRAHVGALHFRLHLAAVGGSRRLPQLGARAGDRGGRPQHLFLASSDVALLCDDLSAGPERPVLAVDEGLRHSDFDGHPDRPCQCGRLGCSSCLARGRSGCGARLARGGEGRSDGEGEKAGHGAAPSLRSFRIGGARGTL